MAQQIHPGDPAYAPPLIRPPSPASSIGTAYGDDETSDTDDPAVINDVAFDQRVFDSLLIHQPSDAEVKANADPLLPRPEDPAQEQLLFKQVMENLRGSLRQLEADARFDEALYPLISLAPSTLPHAPRANEQPTASGSVDDIMRRMMALPVPSTPPPVTSTSHQPPIWPVQPVPITAPLPLFPNGGVGPSAENFLMASPEVAKPGPAAVLPMLVGPQGRPLPSPSRPTSPTLVMGLGRPPLSSRGAAGKAGVTATSLPMPIPMGTGTLAARRISQSKGRAHHELGNTTRMHPAAPEQRGKNTLGSSASPTEDVRRRTRSQTAKAAVAGRPRAL